jgi:alpha-D-xyloside xylohydrolase
VAHKYRELRIPVDNIVQDWFRWRSMGEPEFNKNYPDPPAMMADLHENNFHVISRSGLTSKRARTFTRK